MNQSKNNCTYNDDADEKAFQLIIIIIIIITIITCVMCWPFLLVLLSTKISQLEQSFLSRVCLLLLSWLLLQKKRFVLHHVTQKHVFVSSALELLHQLKQK